MKFLNFWKILNAEISLDIHTTNLHSIHFLFTGFESFTGQILTVYWSQDGDTFKNRITLKYWECSNGNGKYLIAIKIAFNFSDMFQVFNNYIKTLLDIPTAKHWIRTAISPAEFYHVRYFKSLNNKAHFNN
jgi:hypothetical protein